jgi:hypothetical protein
LGLKISIRTVKPEYLRYESLGDYFLGPDEWLMIQVADLQNWKHEILVALHEFIECALVINKGISIREIDHFDITFDGEGEPGDDPKSPYHREHLFATEMEKQMAERLGVDWDDYLLPKL